ncbi:MAG: hypothetical protein L3J28_13380 [Candidatus Polarisedimenticolaceae bacterium]|nr:hypothetical protein [Candidatus Polarisedimenticolaceae bacterium]
MENNFNPLIQEGHPAVTLSHVHDVLTFLQEFFLSSDLPSTGYEKSIHVGIYWVLTCSKQALTFEMERLDS